MGSIYFILQIKVLLPVILATNLALVLRVKPYWRFLLPVALWMLLVISFFILADANTRAFDRIDHAYDESTKGQSYGDTALWQQMNARRAETGQTQRNLFLVIGAQTLLTVAFQIAGYFMTGRRNLYWWTRTLFIMLATAWLLLAALWAIVPTGPLM
jgi:hypothetical protein